jgi:photosystem I subunit VIII
LRKLTGCNDRPPKLAEVCKEFLEGCHIERPIGVHSQVESFNHRKEINMTGSYAASFLPWILVPVIGWVFPAVAMSLLFLYVEKDA